MKEAYLIRSRVIGDVVCQQLSKGFCEKSKKTIRIEIEALPNWAITERRQLPKTHGIYFVLNECQDILYVGKATGGGFYGRWSGTHHKLIDIMSFCDDAAWIYCFLVKSLALKGNLDLAEEALIWALRPSLNKIPNSYATSYAEVFQAQEISLALVSAYLNGGD